MNIKLDENLPDRLVAVLAGLGRDVDTVFAERLTGRGDEDVWRAAQSTRPRPSAIASAAAVEHQGDERGVSDLQPLTVQRTEARAGEELLSGRLHARATGIPGRREGPVNLRLAQSFTLRVPARIPEPVWGGTSGSGLFTLGHPSRPTLA